MLQRTISARINFYQENNLTQQQKFTVDFQEHIASQFHAFQAIAEDTASAVKKIMELNMSANHNALEHCKTGVPHLFAAISPEDFATRIKNFSTPANELTQHYAKAAIDIFKEASARVSKVSEKQFSDGVEVTKAATNTLLADVTEHFPVAGAHVSETMKKVMSTAQESRATLSKQLKSFVSDAEEKITKTMRSAKH
jgi:hypothetical protein